MKQTTVIFLLLFLFKAVTAQKKHSEIKVPYTPLIVKEKVISLMGKELDLNTDGLPAMIETFFNPELTAITTSPNKLVTEPIHFHIISTATHKDIKWKNGELTFISQKPESVSWKVNNTSDSLTMEVDGMVKFDGSINYTVKITALDNINLDNITLHIPFTPEAAKYLQQPGLNKTLRPEVADWKWSAAKEKKAAVWVGDVNMGLHYILKDNQQAGFTSSWSNGDQGGISIAQKGKAILADNYSGKRHMKKGESLYYNFDLQITPDHMTAMK